MVAHALCLAAKVYNTITESLDLVRSLAGNMEEVFTIANHCSQYRLKALLAIRKSG